MSCKKLKILIGRVLVTGVLSGLAGCGSISSKSTQTEEKAIASKADDITEVSCAEEQNQELDAAPETEDQPVEMETKGNEEDAGSEEVEVVNAIEFGNLKEVLDNMVITSNVEIKETTKDEVQIEFELKNVGLCTFVAGKGEELVLPDDVFVESTKIEWTALTADGEYIFPYMKVNEAGDMFMIDWTYNGYSFAIYGKSPQDTSHRDMAGKIALAIIYNLSEVK